MSRIINMRIGTKLAVAAVLSILLIGAMIFVQASGNGAVRDANQLANSQQTLARDAVDAKASIRAMQIAVRDIRLASNPGDLQKARGFLEERQKSAIGFVDAILKVAMSGEIGIARPG